MEVTMSEMVQVCVELDCSILMERKEVDCGNCHCHCNEIEARLKSHGAKHIQMYLPGDSFVAVACQLPLDNVDSVRYIEGVTCVTLVD
jgi:hypothetical protein